MSQSKDTFTAGEVRELVYYSQTVIFDAVQAPLRANKEECEAITLRMLRQNARLAFYPELILEEISKEEVNGGGSLSREFRESLFNLLGNRSQEVVSLSDDDLIREVKRQVRSYH
ncbi:MAG: hypothetical protein ABSA11_16050 [Candidatus Bathyarchaeia archaeon]|jgi:hypothetical protein